MTCLKTSARLFNKHDPQKKAEKIIFEMTT